MTDELFFQSEHFLFRGRREVFQRIFHIQFVVFRGSQPMIGKKAYRTAGGLRKKKTDGLLHVFWRIVDSRYYRNPDGDVGSGCN